MTESRDVDKVILECLNLEKPKSFFLFAGAGSGKTRSLVTALSAVRDQEVGKDLRLSKRRVAVITYTNAACDEIMHQLDFDPVFSVSTIHSFSWNLIRGFQSDIREWVRKDIAKDLADLNDKQSKGRASKASIDRAKKIESKSKRLQALDSIKQFQYSPDGDNRGRDSLNHAEVIGMTADFLTTKPLMQSVLTRGFPFLLIDECQDTNHHLMDAFFHVQSVNAGHFALGLFGDVMQRIYADGKQNLEVDLPQDWVKPEKSKNHRCPKRVIRLINRIRKDADGRQQVPKDDQIEGVARIFLVSANCGNKGEAEATVKKMMSETTNDPLWFGENADIKTLTLEHHMAATRMGFLDIFEPLYKVDRFRTGLIDGSLAGLNFFGRIILPAVRAHKVGDSFSVARIVRQNSPLLSRDALAAHPNQVLGLEGVHEKVKALLGLWNDGKNPKLIDVLYKVYETGLFVVPDSLLPIAMRDKGEREYIAQAVADEQGEDADKDEAIEAWDAALLAPFDQLERYDEYISDEAQFDTHQGVKGLEFPRVMVIIDDAVARGFLFDYEKLFGVEPPSETDQKNIREGKETSTDRTRRLFYVTCSRAKASLAIVAYSKNVAAVKEHVLSQGWFEKEEVIQI